MTEAGGSSSGRTTPDPAKTAALAAQFPGVQLARSEDEVWRTRSVQLVAGAAVPADHAALGLRVMAHDKDYFCDKPALTTLGPVGASSSGSGGTGRKYAVYYSERVHVESAVFAGELVQGGALGRALQVIGMGPTRQHWRPGPRGSSSGNATEASCATSGATRRTVLVLHRQHRRPGGGSQVANYAHRDQAGLEDFGDCHLVRGNGATGTSASDWFTPAGLSAWGDGRTFLLGTDGYIELRKYLNVGAGDGGTTSTWWTAAESTTSRSAGRSGSPFRRAHPRLPRADRAGHAPGPHLQGRRAMRGGRAGGPPYGVGRSVPSGGPVPGGPVPGGPVPGGPVPGGPVSGGSSHHGVLG